MESRSSETDYLKYNTLALAFLGDAVYEQFIREHLIRDDKVSGSRPDIMNRSAVKFVKATAQCESIKRLVKEGFLSEEELSLVKRARNHRVTSKAKHASMIEYKWATAFEALLGYLYLSGQSERLVEVMEETYE